MPKVWDTFEWDDADKKNGNVQHLREHGIEPEEAEGCFFHSYTYCQDDRFADVYILDGVRTAVGVCGWFFKTKAIGSRGFSLVGT